MTREEADAHLRVLNDPTASWRDKLAAANAVYMAVSPTTGAESSEEITIEEVEAMIVRLRGDTA